MKGSTMDNDNEVPEGTAPTDEVASIPSDADAAVTGDSENVVGLMRAFAQVAEANREVGRKKKRRMLTIASALALVLVVSLIVIGVSGPGANDAAAQVELGARTTLAAHSAALNISGSLTVNGQSMPVTGSGYADLSTGLVDATLSFSANGTSLSETELADGTNLYMQIVGNGKNEVSQLLPGKTWVELPVRSASSSGVGTGATNIMSQLQVLTQQGNTVTSLGASTINDVAVTGYQVTFSPTAIAAAMKRVERQSGASSQMVKTIMQVFEKDPPVVKLWLDANHLLRREEASISISAAGSSASVDVTMDFTNYGTPISVTIPPASQVGSYKDFMNAAATASGGLS
jgi:hypothetical protein